MWLLIDSVIGHPVGAAARKRLNKMPAGCPHRTAKVIAREAALTSLPTAAAPLRVAHCLVGLAEGGKGALTNVSYSYEYS